MTAKRLAISALVLSGSALVALVAQEGYTDKAIVPVKGDVPTLGHGSTTHADGTPVRMGDTTTPVKALQRTLAYVQKQDMQIKQCVTADLYQIEYDTLADFGYQYGIGALCKSSMVRLANAGDYAGSCKAYLQYRFVAGYDCSTPGNKRCYGVWTRQLKRYNDCMGAGL